MKIHRTDVLFINADSSQGAYQELSANYAAIEPPTWALLLAQSVRSKGWSPKIIDANAERLPDEEVLTRIKVLNPMKIDGNYYLFVTIILSDWMLPV